MRRFGRWLLNGVTALSLMLCIVTVALWVRSYRPVGGDHIAHYHFEVRGDEQSYERYHSILSERGGLALNAVIWPVTAGDDDALRRHWAWEDTGSIPFHRPSYPALSDEEPEFVVLDWHQRFQVIVDHHQMSLDGSGPTGRTYPFASYVVVAPHWTWAALTAIAPVLWVSRWLRRPRRRPPGCCPVCGYDLRATPAQCPECGRAAAPARAV